MTNLFYEGGPLFMGILTLIALAMLALAVVNSLKVFSGQTDSSSIRKIGLVKEVGLFALITGILGTLVGLFEAFDAIERAGDISLGLLVGGLKVAMITILYGFVIYITSLLIWFVLQWKMNH